MSKKLIQAAAGAAGGESVYVEDVFSTYLYTGTGSALDITNNIDLSGEGGAVWIKNRTNVSNHALFDTERGAEKLLFPDDSAAEQDRTADNDSLGAFNSDGFSLQASSGNRTNESGSDFVSWSFRKQAGFFDVVTYTGDGTSSRDIAHNLGSKPGFMLTKRLTTGNWTGYHQSLGYTKRIYLDLTNFASTNAATWVQEPTATHFTVGSENTSGNNYIAYLFAHDDQSFGDNSDESIIKCGSFTTNASGNAVVSDLGFEPNWLMIKRSSGSGNWEIRDDMRGFGVGASVDLKANVSDAEGSPEANKVFATATGFEANVSSSSDYIYIAIRRPMKTPEAGTEVFDLSNPNTTRQANAEISSNLSYVDMFWTRFTGLTDGFDFYNRLRGQVKLDPTSTAAEATQDRIKFDKMNGVTSVVDWTGGTSYDFIDYFFKRATGFFDVVAYTGDGTFGGKNHNLGVVPELIINKGRNSTQDWYVWLPNSASPGYGFLRQITAFNNLNIAATSTTFDPVWDTSSNTYIAYLFATLAGVSKVGSYTGTGSNVDVDCGFSAGARFILIKRTDSTGDWYVYDSARGIVAGNDPYLLLNSTAAEVTSTDYIDPLNAGFTVTSSAPAALNASGGTYIFLAIA